MAGNEPAARSGCPVEEYSTAGPRKEPLAYFRRLDELRDRSRPFFWPATEPGYYVFLDHDVIVDGLPQPDIFPSSVTVPDATMGRASGRERVVTEVKNTVE